MAPTLRAGCDTQGPTVGPQPPPPLPDVLTATPRYVLVEVELQALGGRRVQTLEVASAALCRLSGGCSCSPPEPNAVRIEAVPGPVRTPDGHLCENSADHRTLTFQAMRIPLAREVLDISEDVWS